MATRDVEEVTMEDIAKVSQYSRRNLYRHFGSRDEIFLLILIEDLRSRWAAQQEAIARVNTGWEKIRVWGEALFDFSRENPQSLHLQMYWDRRGVDPSGMAAAIFSEFGTLNEELADGLREIFSLGVRDGSLRPHIRVDLCISQYLYTLRSVIHRALSPTYTFASFDADDYVRHYIDLFGRAIRNPQGAEP